MEESTALTPEVLSADSATKRVSPNWPTASGLDRAIHCAGSMALPQVYSAPGKAAVRGTVLHKFIETARAKSRQEALAEIEDDDLRNQAAAIDLDSLPVGAESEVALAYNPSTGEARRLALKGQRAYEQEDGWLYGTADLVGIAEDYIVVCDVKTGIPAVSAYESWQLRFLATAAAVLAEKRMAKVAMLYLNENGNWRSDWAEFTTKDLGRFAAQLREMQQRGLEAAEIVAAGGVPALATGPWCRYCKSMTMCPAQYGLIRALVPTLSDLSTRIAAMTPQEKGIAYLKYEQAKKLVEMVGESFGNVMDTEPIPLGNGMVMKKVWSSRSSVSKDAARYIATKYNVDTLLGCATVDIKTLSAQIKADLESAGLIESKRYQKPMKVKEKK